MPYQPEIAIKNMGRVWRPLHVVLAFLQTRSEEFAAEVEQDPNCGKYIDVNLDARLAYKEVENNRPLPTVESCKAAWARLRAWIEDGKVQARGTAVDRHNSGLSGVDITRTHGVMPPEEAAGLVLWDEPSTDETWLKPDDPAIFGQGRHWKRVEINWLHVIKVAAEEDAAPTAMSAPPAPDKQRGTFPNPHLDSKSPYASEIWKVALTVFPEGIPENYKNARLRRSLEPKLREANGVKLPNHGLAAKTYGKALSTYRRKAAE
jgi:hypothetical protein